MAIRPQQPRPGQQCPRHPAGSVPKEETRPPSLCPEKLAAAGGAVGSSQAAGDRKLGLPVPAVPECVWVVRGSQASLGQGDLAEQMGPWQAPRCQDTCPACSWWMGSRALH